MDMAYKTKGRRADIESDVELYKEYRDPKSVASELAKAKEISRSGLYGIVKRVEAKRPDVKLAMDELHGKEAK